jgi:hypothetical protein
MYPRDKAQRKVDMGGEPKERCMYATKRARGRELIENKAVEGKEGMGGRGTVKNHKSECGDLVPERKGVVEVGVSKILTEVGVKMARPWGRIKGEMPMREWDKSESGKK